MRLNKISVFWTTVCALYSVKSVDSFCGNETNKCSCSRFTNHETNLPNLVANCAGLGFENFPNLDQFPDDLMVLDLSLNSLDSLNLVLKSQSLTKLQLSHNNISRVTKGFFNGLPQLDLINLSHNNLSSFNDDFNSMFSQQQHLVYLDLSFNKLKQLPKAVFEPLAQLKYLDLSYNQLGAFLMQSKDVLSRTLGVGINITHLKLNNVGLEDLHPDYFSPYVNLKHLELTDNFFFVIPTVPYSAEVLDFSGNNLEFASARYLNYHSLKELRLSRMTSFTSIHHYAFYNLKSLETLVITDCPNLHEFSELAFGLASKATTVHPKQLILSRNGLTSLNSTYQYMFQAIKHIDLRHNQWECNCDILWLQELNGGELYKNSEIRCATPSTLRGRSVLELTHTDMQQCFPAIYGKASHRIIIVVLMLIVIALMGLVFYLLRYPIGRLDPRHIGISPTSPYSVAPQEAR